MIKTLVHSALFALLISLAGATYGQVPQIEREALVALYNSTDGANWTDNTGWLGEVGTECSWFGVICDSGSVFSLSLMINSLTGTIPNELGDLAGLAILNLNGNSLSGSIPTELGNLSNLEGLNFYGNSLSGTIPSELGSLTKLSTLGLGRNSLTGPIPIELGNLTILWSLELSYNSLSGTIPKELGNLTNLYNLSFERNSLSGSIPSELGNLANLNWLNLSYNLLTGGIPKEIGNLINLSKLILRDNNLSGILPTELENLTKITDFDIWDGENSFSGTIPEVWEKLPKQRKFIHHNNHFVRDVDNDGIDDEIDSDLAASSPVKQITTPDYSISILGSGRVVNLVSNTTYKDKFKDLTSGTKPTQGDMQAITKILYAHFEDEFDYIMVNSGCVDKRKCISKAGTYGTHYSVKNDVKGIGREPIDLSAEFGSSGKLKGALYFPHMNGVTEGPSLHEIMHSWGNDFTTFDQYRGSAEPGDTAFTCPGHWGWSNVGGQLGGWKPHTLETLSNGSYQAKGPAVHWDYAKDNDPQYHFGSVAQGDNLAPYGKFELYLMGLIGADEVGHDIKIAQDFDWKDQAKGIFNATAIHTLALEGIIAKEGPRVPSSKDSQKDFRAMYVIVSDEPLELNEWGYIDKQVYDFQFQGDDGNRDYNFWEATEGKATMTYDGAGDFLKTQATLKALVNPPAVSITGGDRTIADSDKVTGESVNLTATASDSDGTIATTQWLVDGVEVGTGLSASVSLPNGSTVVTFKATDNDGESSTTTATITVEAPAYNPTEVWPAPYSGVTPDTSLGLAFNNIGIFNSSDATIYACLRLFTNGLPSSVNGVGEFDIGLEVVSLSDLTVQITKSREFNTIDALNEKVQTPDCSGIFETTSGLYTDIIQVNSSVLETVWSLIDSTKLILKLVSSKELTAN